MKKPEMAETPRADFETQGQKPVNGRLPSSQRNGNYRIRRGSTALG